MCGGGVAAGLALGAAANGAHARYRSFGRALLADSRGDPFDIDALVPGQEHLFFYPYRSTPCFLLRLPVSQPRDRPLQWRDGARYPWPGGVGADAQVVAFSAICSHKLSHPARQVSFIGYRDEPVGFLASGGRVRRRARVIQCCSEHSVYDPAEGCQVLAGPAPHPLAAVVLDCRDGRTRATGLLGETVLERYFQRFGFRLALEYGEDGYRQQVGETTTVHVSAEYCRNRIRC